MKCPWCYGQGNNAINSSAICDLCNGRKEVTLEHCRAVHASIKLMSRYLNHEMRINLRGILNMLEKVI